MKKPTEEQIKELWEWCGFTWTNHSWRRPNGERRVYLPQRTLNNLFKYAVPKYREDHPFIRLFERWAYLMETKYGEGDPALVLFWVICEVIK